MKTDIHPKYFAEAKIHCSCGNVIVTGSTRETLKTELCSKCHPFYTGQQKLVDTAGRVDKFQAARKKADDMKAAAKMRKETKKKAETYTEKQVPQEVLERAMNVSKTESESKWGGAVGDPAVMSSASETPAEKKPAKKATKTKSKE